MIVVSKYFGASCKSDMDESLLDFQEPKGGNLKYQHTEQKLVKPIKTRRKRNSRPKGQKDIRNILKAKKNDLVKYTEDFNSVCRQSGLDVDSEQLQIAIALSKSEQVELENNSSESQETLSSESLNSQERTEKIRTTLLEYGFKVPEVKINFTIKKKTRKFKKDSKLLRITDEERQQKISVKYAQVLFNNCVSLKRSQEISSDIYPEIYCKATYTKFESLKNDNFFVIDNIIEKSTTSIGSLLKDWSKIPGRPQSPCLKITKLSFSDLTLSESELDLLLSGTFSIIKKTIFNKYSQKQMEYSALKSKHKEIDSSEVETEHGDPIQITNANMKNGMLVLEKNINNPTASTTQQHRSCSPDIFEDESICIVENTPIRSIHLKEVMAVETENINTSRGESIDIFSLPCSQKSDDGLIMNGLKENVTKRISNDFMELTECLVDNILPRIDVYHAEDKIKIPHDDNLNNTLKHGSDLILRKHNNSNRKSDDTEITECVNLTNAIGKHNCNQSNDINKTKNNIKASCRNTSTECVDLTTNDNYSDDLGNSTIIYEYDSLSIKNCTKLKAKGNINIKKSPHVEVNSKECRIEEHIDLTQESRSTSPIENISINDFDEFMYNHSDRSSGKESEVGELEVGHCSNELNTYDGHKNSPIVSKAGSSGIDYPEKISSPIRENSSKVRCLNHNDEIIMCNALELNSQETASSQSSQIVFEISDEELDYSMNECKSEKLTISDKIVQICDKDNILAKSNTPYNNTIGKGRTSTLDRSLSDSCLPVVEIKGMNTRVKSSRNIDKPKSLNNSPAKTSRKDVVRSPRKVETPKNSEYFIKTCDVTPVVDYERLSTPERIKELDKYGLKPLKRKRAIQILKHLYNQTHPIMENLSHDSPSPSKRRKTNDSPLKNKSPNKQICDYFPIKKCTPTKSEKENIFAVTSDIPVIKEVDCHPDDWVFQKREKAKVHTCKVPLHIAFHNYVSSRYALREAILQYQPIEIDIVHKELAEYGHKYDPKDLLRFLDKKCITVKTTDYIKHKR